MAEYYPFFFSFAASFALTPLVGLYARRRQIVDSPEDDSRKTHSRPVPLLGGIAVIGSFLAGVAFFWSFGAISDGIISLSQIGAVAAGSVLLAGLGWLDDRRRLSPWVRLAGWAAVSAGVVASGITILYVTNPFQEGTGPYGRSLLYFTASLAGGATLGSLIAFVWLMVMMAATKILDGLDGLVSGMGVIGGFILYVVSLFWDAPQSGTSVLALLFAGSCAGFLVWNWHPARIFLGESGSVFIGFLLGVLSIISGAKIATTLLVMGIPLLDVVWVVFQRVWKRVPIFSGDRRHLHFRLLDIGLSHRQAVLVLYAFSLVFGASALFLQSAQKVIALGVLAAVMALLVGIIMHQERKKGV